MQYRWPKPKIRRRPLGFWLSQYSITVKKTHIHDNSYKGKYLFGADLWFKGLVSYQQDRKHGSTQVDMVSER